MILDFPTKEDFFSAANDYLNSSWDSVTEYLHEFENLHDVIDGFDHEEESKRYWGSAKQALVSATALVQQAVEFYIKGRIVEVSPYLLISGNPQSWPRGSHKKDVEFSAFRTLDAQDLIRVHDTVCFERFDDKFIQWNDKLRSMRNKVMHTVDKSLSVTPEEAIEFILYTHYYFNNSQCWFASRRLYLEKTPANSMKSIKSDYNDESNILLSLLTDFRISVGVLSPAQCKRYFDYDKKAKSVHCPQCAYTMSRMDFWDHEFIEQCAKTYQRQPDSDFYECKLCRHKGKILEIPCEEMGCEGTQRDSELGTCFSCFA